MEIFINMYIHKYEAVEITLTFERCFTYAVEDDDPQTDVMVVVTSK